MAETKQTDPRKADNRSQPLHDKRIVDGEMLFEAAPDAMVLVNREGQIVHLNKRTESMFGYSRTELLGQPVGIFIPEPLVGRHREHQADFFAAPRERPMSACRNLVGRRKDGGEIFVDIHLAPIELNGELLALAAVRDATERRQAQEAQARLAAIVQSSPAGIVSISQDGTITDWNRGAERLFGYSAAEAIGQSVRVLVPPERVGEYEQAIEKLNRGKVVREHEGVAVHKDGTRINVAVTASRFDGGSWAIQGFCGIVHDVSGRKRLEQQIAELSDRERQTVGQQLHDSLGQQITGIGMIVAGLREQLGDQSPPASVVAKLEASVQEAQRQLRALANGLFPVAVDAHGLVVALEKLAHETAELHDIDCVFEYLEPIPLEDNFAATQLFLIAREAVHNAVKHGHASWIVIELHERDGIKLTVRDDGTGISDDMDETSGMGLRIMRHRCCLIDGTFQLESPAGGGALVTCSLRRGVDEVAID